MSSFDTIRSADAGSLPAGTLLNGIYEIEDKIASGGMGDVYRGRNVHSGDRVAIKVVRVDIPDADKVITMFRREAAALNGLDHPAIVRYHLFSLDPELKRPYLVMEYVEGRSLKEVAAMRALSVDEVLVLGRRVGGGLEAAHARGIFHRDISPDNIILPGDDPRRAKIIDFGIARQTGFGAEGTVIGDGFAGKYNYVSPEQLGLFGGDVGAASDIYSLGLVLAEAATGRAIDMRGNPMEVVEKRRGIPDLSALPLGLRPLIARMLTPNPLQRPTEWATVEACLTTEKTPTSPPAAPSDLDRTILATAPPPLRPTAPPSVPPPARPSPPPFVAPPSTAMPRPQPAGFASPPPQPPAVTRDTRVSAPGAPGSGRSVPFVAIAVIGGLVAAATTGGAVWWFSRPPGTPRVASSTTVRPPAAPAIPGEPTPPVAPTPSGAAPTETAQTAAGSAVPADGRKVDVEGNDAIADVRIDAARPADVDRYLADYARGSCIHLAPVTTEAGAATTEAYGTSVRPFEVLDVDFKRAFGFSIDILVHPVMADQCPVIERLAKARRDGVREPRLEIVHASVPKGGHLAGEVGADPGTSVAVLMVEDDGMARPILGQKTIAPDGAPIPFLTQVEPRTPGGDKPQLVLAVASRRPIEALGAGRSLQVGPFLEQLERQAVGDGPLALAARYVVVKR